MKPSKYALYSNDQYYAQQPYAPAYNGNNYYANPYPSNYQYPMYDGYSANYQQNQYYYPYDSNLELTFEDF